MSVSIIGEKAASSKGDEWAERIVAQQRIGMSATHLASPDAD